MKKQDKIFLFKIDVILINVILKHKDKHTPPDHIVIFHWYLYSSPYPWLYDYLKR